jgi:phosphatidylglycerophosphatase A
VTAAAGAPRLAERVATVWGIGRLPEAPGTWASVAAVPAAWGLHAAGGFPLLAAATAAAFAAGWWAVARYLPHAADGDPSEVVIDEVVGMWLALWPLSAGLWLQGVPGHVFPWPGWALGFAAFRFFDILKPPPVGRFDRMPGAAGVMLDDVAAGVLAALVASAAAIVAHGVMA